MSLVKLGPSWYLFPMPAALIGANVDGRANFMLAAFVGTVNYEPPILAVGLRKNRYTLKGAKANQTFSVCLPSPALVKQADYCGIHSGRKKDKSKLFRVFYGQLQTAPLIEECPVNLECRLVQEISLPTHITLLGEVVETHVQEACLTNGEPDIAKIDPLVYSPSDSAYFRVGPRVAKAFSVGREWPD